MPFITLIDQYVAFRSGTYEGLKYAVSSHDIGANYYINGRNAKLTLEYHRIKGDIR